MRTTHHINQEGEIAMKTIAVLWIIAGLAASSLSQTTTRLSAYGSNPYLSWEMFPQDISAWHGNFISYFPSYEKKPYWGDIDQPANKPNGTYTSTGIDIVGSNANFSHSANILALSNVVGYAYRLPSGVTANFDLDYDLSTRHNSASGNFTADTNYRGSHLPFEYSMVHMLNDLHVQGMMAFTAFGVPAGMRLKAGFENTLFLDHSFEFTKSDTSLPNPDTSFVSDRTVWGWSTVGCNHIFGVRGTQGDAWLQNGYAQGPLYDFDLQSGITLPVGKIGARFAYRTGHQDYYEWQADGTVPRGDSVVGRNFVGTYVKDDWSKTTRDALGRVYGNIAWKKSDRFGLNLFALAGFEGSTEGQALSSNLNVASDAKDKARCATIEAAPNLLIPFGSAFSYIDAAVDVGYSYARFDNTYKRWVGGGQIETYRDSWTTAGDENSWEGYSYANRNSMDAGFDLSTMFPLVTNDIHKLGLGLQLLINSKFTFMTKYYGHNIDQGTTVDFQVDNRRQDFEREVQFATGVKMQYQLRPFFVWFEVTEPLLHSLLPRTRVTDASGDNVLYEHEKSPLWLSIEGMRVGLHLTYEMTPSFLSSR